MTRPPQCCCRQANEPAAVFVVIEVHADTGVERISTLNTLEAEGHSIRQMVSGRCYAAPFGGKLEIFAEGAK